MGLSRLVGGWRSRLLSMRMLLDATTKVDDEELRGVTPTAESRGTTERRIRAGWARTRPRRTAVVARTWTSDAKSAREGSASRPRRVGVVFVPRRRGKGGGRCWSEPIEGLRNARMRRPELPFTKHPGGMRTNGGCKCLFEAVRDVQDRRDIQRLIQWKMTKSRLRAPKWPWKREVEPETVIAMRECLSVAWRDSVGAQADHGTVRCHRRSGAATRPRRE